MKPKKLISILFVILIISVIFLVVLSFTTSEGNSTILSKDLGSDNVSIAITGDVMFGRKMPGVLSSGDPFRNVANVTKNANVLLVNFENPVTTSSDAVKGDVPLKASPEYTHLLAEANDNVIAAQANNHAFDYGLVGMNDSLKNLKDAGVLAIGAGQNIKQVNQQLWMLVIEKLLS